MNDSISWDPTLIKKFSSSNHYKLLNQLRNEVKKYPLNNKKKIASRQNNDTNKDNKDFSNTKHTQENSFSLNSTNSYEVNKDKSTVSFNNAKNFSIYKQNNSNINSRNNEIDIPDPSKSNAETLSPTFKDRLNQIDMN